MKGDCFLYEQTPEVEVAYTCVSNRPESDVFVRRFVETYHKCPPAIPTRLTTICNGGPLLPDIKSRMSSLGSEFFERSNDGWDIGGYIEFSKITKAELLVCLGESVFFHRPSWLARLVDARRCYGPGIYGCLSSRLVRTHLQTTAFAIDPKFLASHPKVQTKRDRYDFEHGPRCIWHEVVLQGGAAKLVTFDGCYNVSDWRLPDNILWRGDQSNCLVWCNHTEKWRLAQPHVKDRWSRGADGNLPRYNNMVVMR